MLMIPKSYNSIEIDDDEQWILSQGDIPLSHFQIEMQLTSDVKAFIQ